jgi:2-iminobutanoate/2-iminopropanoate deaminase
MKAKRRDFMKRAAGVGGGAALAGVAAVAQAAGTAGRVRAPGGVRIGNLYFSSGLTGVREEARKNPLAFGGDIKEQTERILEMHKKNLEAMGSSLENVIKVTVFLADVKTEKNAMNEVYAKYFPKDPPARSAVGVEFPDTATRVEIELVAWIPG